MNGTAVCGEPVVVVEINHGDVRLKTGRIATNPSSYWHADNRKNTVVCGDREFRPPTDPLEDGREKEFCVDDIHLLKAEEANALRNPEKARDWFGSVYQDWVVDKIQRSLKRLKL